MYPISINTSEIICIQDEDNISLVLFSMTSLIVSTQFFVPNCLLLYFYGFHSNFMNPSPIYDLYWLLKPHVDVTKACWLKAIAEQLDAVLGRTQFGAFTILDYSHPVLRSFFYFFIT